MSALKEQPRHRLTLRFVSAPLEAGLFNALVEQCQIIEHPHHRPDGEDGGFLQDRHGGRAVRRVDPERATGLLRQDRAAGSHAGQKPTD